MKGLDEIIKDNNPDGDHEEYTKGYNFDDLDEDVQDEVVREFMEYDSGVWNYALETLRHMTFAKDGEIVKGYDE